MERLISSSSPSSSLIPRPAARLLSSPSSFPSIFRRPSRLPLKPISASLFSKQEGPPPPPPFPPLQLLLSENKTSKDYQRAQVDKAADSAAPLLQKVATSAVVVLLSALIVAIIQPILVQPAYATAVQSAAGTGGKLIRSELLSSAWTGFFAGCLHTLSGPDHLAALAPLSIGRTRVESAIVGALWGCGHDAGQVIFGLLFLLLKDRLHIEVIRTWGTRVVGLTLLVIGVMGIREASEVPTPCVALENGECDVSINEPLDPATSRKKKIGFATFATGIVHGLQPDALMMVLPALALPSRLAGAAFLGKQEIKVRPLRSSIKPMCELMKTFKKYIQADFVEAMKNTPFGPIFMAFYNEEFGVEKGLKSNVAVLRILNSMTGIQGPLQLGAKRLS